MPEPLIHQTLHGYADGHRQIAGTVRLPANDARLVLTLSDISGPSSRLPECGYLTGYPLAESGMYALARTWAAPEMSRPGCVWTHTLLIDFADLAMIEEPSQLDDLFRCPNDSGILWDYSAPLRIGPESERALTPVLAVSEARAIIAGLYGQPKEPILASSDTQAADRVTLAIWAQQWPRLRRSFRFCTFAASDRSIDGVLFDLQFLPARERSRRSRFADSFEVGHVPFIEEPWLSEVMDDLLLGGRTDLRSFLRQIGGDVSKGREAFAPLCSLHVVLTQVRRGISALEAAIEIVDREFNEREALSARTLLAREAARSPANLGDGGLDFLIDNFGLLTAEDAARAPAQIGREIWLREPARLAGLLTASEQLRDLANRTLAILSLEELVRGLGQALDLVPDIIVQRPEILGMPDFWSIETIDLRMAAALAQRHGALTPHVLDAMIKSRRDSLAFVAVAVFGAAAVAERTCAFDGYLSDSWFSSIASQPSAVGNLMMAGSLRSRGFLARLSRALSPNEIPSEFGTDPWVVAFTGSSGPVLDADKVYLASFLLARAFGRTTRNPGELAILGFETTHEALEGGATSEEAWGLLLNALPQNYQSPEGDHCGRLRESIVLLFADRNLSTDLFIQITSNVTLFEMIVQSGALRYRGRIYLRRLRSALVRSAGLGYELQIGVLDRAL